MDFNTNNLPRTVVWLVYFSLVIYYALEVYSGNIPTFQMGDWLINYEGGVVRRGLIGDFILVFSDLGFPLSWLTFTIQIFIAFLVFYLVEELYFMRDREKSWLLFLFSPAFILFSFHSLNGSFRKEIIVYLSFLILVRGYALKHMSIPTLLASIFLYFIATFSYEPSALFLPFFVFVLIRSCFYCVVNRKITIISILLFSLIAILSIILSFFFHGNMMIERKICNSIT